MCKDCLEAGWRLDSDDKVEQSSRHIYPPTSAPMTEKNNLDFGTQQIFPVCLGRGYTFNANKPDGVRSEINSECQNYVESFPCHPQTEGNGIPE